MSSLPAHLDTERLTLRPPRVDDYDDIHAMWSDPEVMRHVTGTPLSVEETWGRLLKGLGHWALLGCGHWVVREKRGGEFVGEVGFVHLRRGIAPWFDDAPEIGWMLCRAAQRKGYATEAVQAALAWADRRWPGRETVCIISGTNAASLKVADTFAYRRDGEATYRGREVLVLRRAGGSGT